MVKSDLKIFLKLHRRQYFPQSSELNLLQRRQELLLAAFQLAHIGAVAGLVQLLQVAVMVLHDLLVVAAQHEHSDAGALVGGAFQMGQRVDKDQAGVHRANALAQTVGIWGFPSGKNTEKAYKETELNVFFERRFAPYREK